ncbi:hypothetical protein AOLI_G00176330 [Acnodon oligacanthus]
MRTSLVWRRSWQTIFMSASVSERNHCRTTAHQLGGKGKDDIPMQAPEGPSGRVMDDRHSVFHTEKHLDSVFETAGEFLKRRAFRMNCLKRPARLKLCYQGRAVGGPPAGLGMGGRALLPLQREKQQRSNLLQTFLDLSYELVLGLSTDIYESEATRLLGLEMALCQAEV